MNIFEKIWNFLNGNKTIIGLALGWFATKIPEGVLIFGWETLPLNDLVEALAGLFTGVGLVHKSMKSNTDPEPNK
jgi:hypothetical protein